VVFVADDLAAWLIFILAEGGRKKLTSLILGDDPERALRPAATAAVQLTAAELCPGDAKRAEELAIMVGPLFETPPPGASLGKQTTVLEALQAAIAGQLKLLDDPGLTATLRSLTGMRDVSATVVAQKLTAHLVREIVVRGSRGGPLEPLANQLNHDVTHLQGQHIEGLLAQLVDQVTALASAGSAAVAPGKPVRLLPRPAFLAGREDLLADLDARLTSGGGPQIVALHGLGGAGKTSVALAYAHRHLAEVDVAWQFAADDPTVLAAGFAELAAQLGAGDVIDGRDPVASVHGVLAVVPGGWLMIFDNAPDQTSVQAFLPPAGAGQVLITSQNPNWPHGQALEVPPLSAETATDFLVTRTGDPDRRAAEDLAGALDGLPLALEQAAAYTLATGGTLAGYLSLFRQRRAEMLSRGEPTGYPGTVATTWSLAFTRLEQSAPEAIGLLRLLAFCAPDAIPLHLLLRPRPGLTDELIPQVAAVLVPLLEDELAANDAIAALRQYSLVRPVGDGAVSVHRLVQAVTADQMPEELAAQWRQATAAVIEAAIPTNPSQPETWPECALLLPHAQAALTAGSLGMLHIANYVGHSGSYAAARDLYQKALEALGPGHPYSLTALGTLADWAGQAGDAAPARDQWAGLLRLYERFLGPEHPDTLHARLNLAAWTGDAGDPVGARDQFAALLPVMKRTLGAEHEYTLSTRNNLARWTGEAGDAVGARNQVAALLPVLKRTLGPEHPGTLAARGNLAAWTGQADDAAGARDQLAALLPIRERVLGPEHPDTLTTRNNLAYWTGKAGDAAGARDQFAALLRMREHVLGPKHPVTMVTRRNLADWTKAADAAGGRGQGSVLDPMVERENPYRKVGRNAPCPCGSGRKYKHCHGDPRIRDAPG
jgi:hypothetical protein